MKTILYLASSLNGQVARLDDSTGWCEAEWANFSHKVAEVGNLIIGRKTYEIMAKDGEFKVLGEPEIFVVSRDKNVQVVSGVNVCCTPQDALLRVKEKGFDIALMAGGEKLATSCLNLKLIDEIFIDLEPVIFKKGISLFSEIEREVNLQLVNTSQYGDNSVQLHYLVV